MEKPVWKSNGIVLKLKCIDNQYHEDRMIIGKIYLGQFTEDITNSVSAKFYKLNDEKETDVHYYTHCFEIIG